MSSKRAIIVPAVSTPEQAADEKESLDAQERDARAYCEAHNFHIVDVIRIEGFSRSYFTLRELVEAASLKGETGPRRLEDHIKRRDFDVMVVRATNRFNREQSLNAEIIGKTIRLCKAEVHSSLDGIINEQNYRGMIAITGYRDSMEVDELKKRRALGVNGRIGRGQKLSSGIPFGFMEVDDPRHKKKVLAPDPSYRRLFDDLLTVFLDGVPYQKLEQELHARFAHPLYPRMKFRNLLFNAVFWGHNALHYRSKTHPNGRKVGAWIFDAAEEPPASVRIERNTHDAIYKGEQAALMQAEIRRRMDMYGRTRPHTTALFAGLLVCWDCHYTLLLDRNVRTGYKAWRCDTRYSPYVERRGTCSQTRQIPEHEVKAHFTKAIAHMLATNDLGAFGGRTEADLESRQVAIAAEIAQTENNLRRLVEAIKTVEASNPAWQFYTDEIRASGALLSAQHRALADTEREIAQADTADQYRALEDIRAVTLDKFWDLPSFRVNQLLRRLLGKYRLAMEEGELRHVVLAPDNHRRQRKSTAV